MHGNVQTGCELGILENLDRTKVDIQHYYSEGYSYKKIDRICMYLSEEKRDDIETKAFIKFTIIIKHKNGQPVADLEKTLKNVSLFETLKDINVIVASDCLDLDQIYRLSTKYFKPQKVKCLKLIQEIYDDSIDDEAFRLSKNGWICFIDSGKEYHEDLLMSINHTLNKNMELIGCTDDPKFYPCFLYRFLNGNKEKSIDLKLEENEEKIYRIGDILEDYRSHKGTPDAQRTC